MELNIFRPRRFTVVIVAIGLHLNGSTTSYHAAVTPVLVAPGRPQVISKDARIHNSSRWSRQTRL